MASLSSLSLRRARGALALALAASALWSATAQAGTLSNPIDPWQQTALSSFPDRSHWLQPWRAYLDTVPASRLRNAIGINYDPSAEEAPATARLLAASGFRRARIEEAWGSVDYNDRSRLDNLSEFRASLVALRDNGIRPLILLNANHGAPTPTKRFLARLTAPAPQGARQVKLDAATASAVVPGRTGLNALHAYKAADILFTQVAAEGTATLSKPLPEPLGAGSYPATTLAYQPFERPLLRDGSPNPAFEATMVGWLSYVDLVTREGRNTLGSTNFDVEVWNELSFGSGFLDANTYYDPDLDIGTGDTKRAILERTIAWIRDPAHGLSGVGIGNGFANQTPFEAGSSSPLGLTAIDKHPYQAMMRFPGQQLAENQPPLDALGQLDGDLIGDTWVDRYIPRYEAFFPEYHLAAIQAETLVRDTSPIATKIGSVLHGRDTHPPGGPPPQLWITETGLDVTKAEPANPDPPPPPAAYLSAPDIAHLRAKATLRSVVAFVNKGFSAIDFYAAKDPDWALIPGSFFDQVDAGGGAYPGDDAGGQTMAAMRRMMARFNGPDQISGRQLSLQSISDHHDQIQFAGDGTSAHPNLYNRDVLAFLPYQVTDDRFVIPVYIMTRNIAKLYRPEAPASDPTRYDLPPADYQLTIGGVDGVNASASAYDPLTDTSTPLSVVSRAPDHLMIEIPLTDSPRLLELEAPPPQSSPAPPGRTSPSVEVAPVEAPSMRLANAWVADGRLLLSARVSEPLRGKARVTLRYRACGLARSERRTVAIDNGKIALTVPLPRHAREARLVRGRLTARIIGKPKDAYTIPVQALRRGDSPRGC